MRVNCGVLPRLIYASDSQICWDLTVTIKVAEITEAARGS
jgi:hypothetical protein